MYLGKGYFIKIAMEEDNGIVRKFDSSEKNDRVVRICMSLTAVLNIF